MRTSQQRVAKGPTYRSDQARSCQVNSKRNGQGVPFNRLNTAGVLGDHMGNGPAESGQVYSILFPLVEIQYWDKPSIICPVSHIHNLYLMVADS